MVGNINTNEFNSTIPRTWNGIIGYNYTTPEQRYADGWRDVVIPSYNASTQRLGGHYFDEVNDVFTYNIVDKTVEEIQSEIIANASTEQEHLLQERMKEIFLSELQTENDTSTLLANQSLYPLWQSGIDVIAGQKLQHFNSENELVLWEVITSHTTQEDWQPKNVPALFKRVAFEDEYLVWVQPTGVHDAYNVGDIIWYPTLNSTLYRSTVNSNVYPPLVVAGQWEIYNG